MNEARRLHPMVRDLLVLLGLILRGLPVRALEIAPKRGGKNCLFLTPLECLSSSLVSDPTLFYPLPPTMRVARHLHTTVSEWPAPPALILNG